MEHDYPILVIEKASPDWEDPKVVINQQHHFDSIHEFLTSLKD